MSCLLYCIFRGPRPAHTLTLKGVGGGPVALVRQLGLNAAISKIAQPELPGDLPAIRTFGQVIAAFNFERSVIPLRFGCRLPDASRVARLLKTHASRYEALLTEVEGCVEMGIRLLLPEEFLVSSTTACRRPESCLSRPPATPTNRAGSNYLQARRAFYDGLDRETQSYHQFAQQFITPFRGRFVNSKIEGPSSRLPLLSLYFLVPREGVESFRQTFRSLALAAPVKMLLTGPWPPYNFVEPRPLRLPGPP